jgi:hypothetical protein
MGPPGSVVGESGIRWGGGNGGVGALHALGLANSEGGSGESGVGDALSKRGVVCGLWLRVVLNCAAIGAKWVS